MGKLTARFHGSVLVGVAADKVKVGKVEAVVDPREHESLSEVKSFLGLVNYNRRFYRDLETLSEPLRRLMKKDIELK